MDAFTPQQTIELLARTGCKKAHMRLDKLFINSCLSGPLLGFGVNASPWYVDNAPGLLRMLGALLFPIGLVMITLTGADLWTTNIMDVAVSWFVSFFGNLAGTLFSVAIIFGYGGVFEEAPAYQQAAIRIATQKAVDPMWHQIFLRAIGANWLVCMAVLLSIQGRELISKITAICESSGSNTNSGWPTATFVALALDHVVANMFFVPMGIWVGADISVGYYIWKSMIPTALGNFVGAALFVGTAYWYLYLTGEAGAQVRFDLGSLGTAVDAGAGPMRFSRRSPAELEKIEGRPSDATLAHYGSPGGQSHLTSGYLHDFNDNSPYAKTYKERQEAEKATSTSSGSQV